MFNNHGDVTGLSVVLFAETAAAFPVACLLSSVGPHVTGLSVI